MVLTPGPNMMYLVSRSITQGRRAGLISLGGVAVGFLVYLTATNLGLSALFVAVPQMYIAVKLAGRLLPRVACLQSTSTRWGIGCSRRPHSRPTHRVGCSSWGCSRILLNPQSRDHVPLAHPAVRTTRCGPSRRAGVRARQRTNRGIVERSTSASCSRLARSRISCAADRLGYGMQRYLMGTVLGALAIKLATDHARPSPA